MVQATLDHETVYDTIDEYEMASLSCKAEPLRGDELCSTPQLSQSLMWTRAAASLHAGGGNCIDPGPEGEQPPTRELEKVEGKKMQANPAYLPAEMSHKMPEEEYTDIAGPEGERPSIREETEGGGM